MSHVFSGMDFFTFRAQMLVRNDSLTTSHELIISASLSLPVRGFWQDNQIDEEVGRGRLFGPPQPETQRGCDTGGAEVGVDVAATAKCTGRHCSSTSFAMVVYGLRKRQVTDIGYRCTQLITQQKVLIQHIQGACG
jgi:hypothetical protein